MPEGPRTTERAGFAALSVGSVSTDDRSATEAVVRRVLRDRAVGRRQRFTKDVQTAALEREPCTSRQRVRGDRAVLQDERAARRAVLPEGKGDVVDAAPESVAARPADGGGVPGHGRVAQREPDCGEDPTATRRRRALRARDVDMVVVDYAVRDRPTVED